MFPHEHFIVAIVPVVAYVAISDRRLPTIHLVGIVFLGSQFPDLIDKPLGNQFGIIPTGRVFMHSLPTAFVVFLVLGIYGWKTDRIRLSVVFIFAHLSHILADNHGALFGPNPEIPTDMLWPFLPPIPRPGPPVWAGPGEIYVHLWTMFSIVVLASSVIILIDIERQRIDAYREYMVRTTHRLYRSYYAPR